MNWVQGEKNQSENSLASMQRRFNGLYRMKYDVVQGKTKSCINAVAMTVASNSDDP